MKSFGTWSFALMAMTLTCEGSTPADRPDIVLILVDDMGFSDLGCYGGEIDTPNLDALAAAGVRFSQFYNASRCCPTRATLMTGLHPHQVGIGHMTNTPEHRRERQPPAYQGYLNRDCLTLGELLGAAGYATLMTGKWHLGVHAPSRRPLGRGFEKYYGCAAGGGYYFAPTQKRPILLGDQAVELKSTTDRRYYTTDAYTDHAIRFVDEAIDDDDRPFFLYLAYNAPHWPLQAHDEEIAKYRGEYRIGWDELRQRRYTRQIEVGLIDPRWRLSPRDRDVPAWNTLGDAKRDELDLRMAIYAAMVDRVDQNIGKLVEHLRRRARLDNTLLLFLSDNGACAEGGVFGSGSVYDEAARNTKSFVTYGKGWANASSTPYRLYKHFTHEGGACTPLIAHWPDRVIPQSGWNRTPSHILDIVPTLLEVAKAEYPSRVQGRALPQLDGVSLLPALRGESLDRSGPIFTEHEGNAMARDGRWKLVGRGVAGKKRLRPKRWELYDMHADGTELNNRADERRDITEPLEAQWRAWAAGVNVYPKPPK